VVVERRDANRWQFRSIALMYLVLGPVMALLLGASGRWTTGIAIGGAYVAVGLLAASPPMARFRAERLARRSQKKRPQFETARDREP
jgi:uncharacterized membrane protein